MTEIDGELLGIFLTEARGYLERLRDPTSPPRRRAEAAHGLKGAASMVGLERLRSLGQELERRIREHDEGRELVAEVAAELARLASEAGEPTPSPVGAPDRDAAGDPPPASLNLEDQWDADEARILYGFFVDEAREHLERIVQTLLLLSRDRTRTEHMEELFRKTHTLKGAAGTVGLRAIAERAHRLEDRFERLRDGHEELGEETVDRLLAEADLLRELVDQVASQALSPGPPAEPLATKPTTATVEPPPSPDAPPRAATSSFDAGVLDRRGLDRRNGDRRHEERRVLRIDAARLDELMDAVGELVFERTRIERRAQEYQETVRELRERRHLLRQLMSALRDPETRDEATTRLGDIESCLTSAAAGLELSTAGLLDDTAALRRSAAILQDGLTSLRVMPIHWLFARLERPVREAARGEAKQVRLVTGGEETELDKMVVEQITDPVIQLVRNAIAHGIESPEERRRLGKPEEGTVTVAARHQGDFVYLEVADDGAGIDLEAIRRKLGARGSPSSVDDLPAGELLEALFAPGFSTRTATSELAGRGVGLDVVREAIAGLGGEISVDSRPAEGARFVIRLPLTTAITTAVLFKVGGQVYALPAAHVVESSFCPGPAAPGPPVNAIPTRSGEVPVLSLHHLLGAEAPAKERQLPALVVTLNDLHFAVSCDKIIGPREIVIRSLGPLLAPLGLYAGATISGAGKVQLVLDLAALAARVSGTPLLEPPPPTRAPRILLCDDSRSIREAVSHMLVAAGYAVQTAPDGWEAWELLRDHPFEILVTDLEMPRMDGFDLIARVRRDADLRDLPILVLTSRTSVENRIRCDALGSTGFVAKPVSRAVLVERVRDVLRVARRS